MEWYWYVLIVAAIAFIYFHFIGRPDFWKLARQHPEAALRFFESDPKTWMVFYEKPQEGYRAIAPYQYWSGPFRLYVPGYRNLIVIFGRYPQFEEAQKRFVSMMQSRSG